MTTREPERGDLCEIHWVDIQEDVTGDPDEARLAKRTSYGLFWSRGEESGIPTIITTTTLDEDLVGQSGYCIYPAACVRSLKVIKRARRPRKARLHPVSRAHDPRPEKADLPEVRVSTLKA